MSRLTWRTARARATPILVALAALVVGLAVLALGLWAAGYDATAGLLALWRGAFGSWDTFASATLVRAIPLLVLGLGISLAMTAGAINIGGEGQFYAGAMAATWIGLHLGAVPPVLASALMLSASLVAGAAWMAVPVVLRVRFGVLEAISTLLLNFVAEAVVSWMVTGPLQETQHIYPQSDTIAVAAQLRHLAGTRLHTGIFIGLALAAALWWVLARTPWGFALHAVGSSARAARVSGGLRPLRILSGALLVSGALGGLAGGIEVGGVSYALYQNLSPGYGFTAIAVALLARQSPVGVVAASLLFGALEAGAGGMQRDVGIPAVAVNVAEATIIVSVLVAGRLARWRSRVAPAAPAGSTAGVA